MNTTDTTNTSNAPHDDTATYAALDAWIDAHFEQQVQFLQSCVRIPTDTPPGNNAPHAQHTSAQLQALGLHASEHPIPPDIAQAHGMQSVTNLIVRRLYQSTTGTDTGPTIALNAHGDVVPPGEGWTHPPYSATIDGGALYGRAAAVSKSDFATYTYALLALEAVARPQRGSIELHLTYDEELGGELGPLWLLHHQLTRPDLVIAAGFSYAVVTAHNGCLQMKVTVHGQMAHAAIPDTGVDALQASVHILAALYAHNTECRSITSATPGITHPYLNVGRIDGGTHTNVVPGTVHFYLDRRMIPEENPAHVEAWVRAIIEQAASTQPGIRCTIERLLLAQPMVSHPGNTAAVHALQRHANTVLGEPIATTGTPLYTDARHYAHHGIPAVIYGAGPRTVRESNAKRADEHLQLHDLRCATKVIARTLHDLLA